MIRSKSSSLGFGEENTDEKLSKLAESAIPT
jgi:hypothetical protein